MNIQEKIAFLRRRYPAFGQREIWDVDNRGEEFCEMIYPNEKNPTMPITVSVNENGCRISVGQFSHVTGNRPITVEQAAAAIDDIVNDRIVFALGYKDGECMGFGKPFITELFPLTGGEDDKKGELDAFIATLSTPVTGFRRKLTKLKGSFILTDFSGGFNKTIDR
jgi:hypothetical protein